MPGQDPEGAQATNGARYPHADLTYEIIGAFFKVFNHFGFGFSEAGYRRALRVELVKRGLRVEQEVPYEMVYEGVVVGRYRADTVVEGRVIAESKATLTLDPATLPQVMNYLRLSRIPVGLVLHFGPRPAIKRLLSTRFGFDDITDSFRR